MSYEIVGTSQEAAQMAKELLHNQLAGWPYLRGIGIGRDESGWTVEVRTHIGQEGAIPREIAGVRVNTIGMGPIRAR